MNEEEFVKDNLGDLLDACKIEELKDNLYGQRTRYDFKRAAVGQEERILEDVYHERAMPFDNQSHLASKLYRWAGGASNVIGSAAFYLGLVGGPLAGAAAALPFKTAGFGLTNAARAMELGELERAGIPVSNARKALFLSGDLARNALSYLPLGFEALDLKAVPSNEIVKDYVLDLAKNRLKNYLTGQLKTIPIKYFVDPKYADKVLDN